MCRWAAYIGSPIFIADLVSAPKHSLIVQAREAEECKTSINADGFGVAWYAHRAEPGLYRDVFPAWSDPNLRALAEQVRSPLFLAHVRASTGTAISRNNCHPFAHKRWSFMHNGQISGFDQLRKQFDMVIPEELYGARKGATDSEVLFLIALGQGLESDPHLALQRTARIVQDIARKNGLPARLRMALAISDGETLYAVRYASNDNPPSLYYRRSDADDGWIVVSEPLQDGSEWRSVDENRYCVFTKSDMTQKLFEPDCSDEKPTQYQIAVDPKAKEPVLEL